MRVGCFGKLPFWPEYLELGAGFPTAGALKEWLHRGREEFGLNSLSGTEPGHGTSGSQGVGSKTWLRLLLGLPGSTELLVGVLRPSIGTGGRHFPFVVFTHLPRRTYGKHYELFPFAMVRLWEQLDDAWESLAAMASREAFEEVHASLEAAPPPPLREVQEEYRQRQQSSPDGLFARDGASLSALREAMPGVVGQLRRRAQDLGVQLPVSAELAEAGFDASVWIDLLNRQFLFKRFEPTVIIDATPGVAARHVSLKFGALEPADYPPAMGLDEAESVFLRPADPGGPEAENAASPGVPPTYAELLRSRFGASR